MTHNKGDILLIAWLILLTTSLVTAYDGMYVLVVTNDYLV